VDELSAPPFVLPECTLLPAVPIVDFDEMAALTCRVMDVPAAQVNLVDRTQQVFPGAAGLDAAKMRERTTPIAYSFCQYVVMWAEPLVVPDAREHPMLRDNPGISENGVVAYAGMPLRDLQDTVVGTLCVFDDHRRDWTDAQVETLRQLAIVCSAQLQLVESKAKAAVLDERDRMALDLHESVARELLGLSMMLGSARSQAQGGPVAHLMDTAMSSVDTALSNLRASVYDRSTAANT
jgi:GAF domain-containing protein